jgi:hypothetical protein
MSMRWVKVCTMTAVFAGVFGASTLSAADDKKDTGLVPVPVAPAPAATAGVVTGNCGPVYQTVKVTEMVPTTVAETRNVWKNELRTETYTAYKNEIVAEQQTHNVMVNRMVSETVMEARTSWVSRQVTTMEPKTTWVSRPVTTMVTKTVTERVPVTKTVTVNETHYTTESVTEMKSRTVHKWVSVPVCKEVGPRLCDRFKGFCDPCAVPCPRTVTTCKKERVCETVCEPVTVCKKVAHCVPVCKQVCSYECVTKQVTCPVTTCVRECVTTQCPVTRCVKECVTTQVPVCKTKCVQECVAKTCTVNVCKKVAYPCTRTVCVPVCSTVTVNVCKMVPTCVEKQVLVSNGNGCGSPCAPACGAPACGDACAPACGSKGLGLKDKLCGMHSAMKDRVGGAFSKIRSCGHRTCAAPSCDLGCGAPACGGCK